MKTTTQRIATRHRRTSRYTSQQAHAQLLAQASDFRALARASTTRISRNVYVRAARVSLAHARELRLLALALARDARHSFTHRTRERVS